MLPKLTNSQMDEIINLISKANFSILIMNSHVNIYREGEVVIHDDELIEMDPSILLIWDERNKCFNVKTKFKNIKFKSLKNFTDIKKFAERLPKIVKGDELIS